MKRLLTIALFFSVLSSCDGRRDFIDSFNDAPYFTSLSGSDTITGEMLDSVKLNRQIHQLPIRIVDVNNNLTTLELFTSQPGAFYLDGKIIRENPVALTGKAGLLAYEAYRIGNHRLTLRVKDAFNKEAQLNISLTIYENIPPVANLEVRRPEKANQFERILDAGGSKDESAIIQYEYNLLGKTILSPNAQHYAFFPENGFYPIRLRVQDEEGVWSETVSITIEINE